MTGKEAHKKNIFKIRRDILVCLFLIIATLAAYWQVRNHEFLNFDDDLYVSENRHVQGGLTMEGIAWSFTATHAFNWHPLTWLSHMLDCHLYGVNSGFHHLTNLFFHIANTLMLFIVLSRMTGYLWRSGFVAALFSLHPLHVESVAWVAERKDVLSTFFWILSMWSYLRYVERPGTRRYLLVVLFFILGLISKPMLVTLPFVLLLLDYWPLNRFQFGQSGRGSDAKQRSLAIRLVKEKIPLFILAAASSAVTFFVQQSGGAVAPLDLFPLNLRLTNALVSYLSYIGNMLWPFHLAFLYPYPGIIPWWQVAGACLVLVSVSYLAIRARERYPYLAVGWLWYIGTLVPVIGLVQVGSQAMADRYTYVPLIGIFVIIAWGVPELVYRWHHKNIGLAAMAAILLSILTATTWLQVQYWSNSITLYEHGIDTTADNHKAHNNLGNALVSKGRLDEAIGHFSEALRMKPRFPEAHFNLGNALVRKGNDKEAIRHFSEALRIKPDYAKACNNLGNALARGGKVKEAARHFSEALRIHPDFPEAHNNLANALASQGNLKEAAGHYLEALRIKPDYAEAHYNLANALAGQGSFKEAAGHYLEALRIKPDYADAHYNLGIALARQGKIKETIRHFSEALRIIPDFPEAHNNLANALARQGSLREATSHYLEALRIRPDYADAHNNLGIALARQGNIREAMGHFSEALRITPDFPEARQNLERGLRLMDKSGEASNSARRK